MLFSTSQKIPQTPFKNDLKECGIKCEKHFCVMICIKTKS